jgi:hypothetical protein
VFLKISSMRGVMRFEEEGRLAYRVALPPDLITLFSILYLDSVSIHVWVERDSHVRKSLSIRLWLGYPSTRTVCEITQLGY